MEARREYTFGTLSSDDLSPSPVDQFAAWLEYAREKGISDEVLMQSRTKFTEFDTNGNGSIDRDELERVYERCE